MHERAPDLAPLLADPNAHFYVCGLKAMEEGVVLALRDVAAEREPRLGRSLAPRSSAKAGCTSRRTDAQQAQRGREVRQAARRTKIDA